MTAPATQQDQVLILVPLCGTSDLYLWCTAHGRYLSVDCLSQEGVGGTEERQLLFPLLCPSTRRQLCDLFSSHPLPAVFMVPHSPKKDRNFTFHSFDLYSRCVGNISTGHLRSQELQEHMFLSVILWLKSVHVWYGNCDFLLKYKQHSVNVWICCKFHQKVAKITMMQLSVSAEVSVFCWFRRNQPGIRERALGKCICIQTPKQQET